MAELGSYEANVFRGVPAEGLLQTDLQVILVL